MTAEKMQPFILAKQSHSTPRAHSSDIAFASWEDDGLLQSLLGQSVHYHDAWTVAGSGSSVTWTTDNPNGRSSIEATVSQHNHARRIDYIFVGGWDAHPRARARIVDARLAMAEPIEGVWLSDHFGVLATLDITDIKSQV